MVCPK